MFMDAFLVRDQKRGVHKSGRRQKLRVDGVLEVKDEEAGTAEAFGDPVFFAGRLGGV